MPISIQKRPLWLDAEIYSRIVKAKNIRLTEPRASFSPAFWVLSSMQS